VSGFGEVQCVQASVVGVTSPFQDAALFEGVDEWDCPGLAATARSNPVCAGTRSSAATRSVNRAVA